MKESGIYQIQSKYKPKRIYIGSSCNIKRRWENHRYDLRKNKHGSSKLQNHFNKYGINDLLFEVIELCDIDKLISKEQFYIDSLNPFFNNCKIANSPLGIKRSDKVRRKQSERMKGLFAGENNPNYGKHHSPESRQKIKKSHENRVYKKHTDEWKEQARQRMLGKNNPNYGKETWQKGKHLSEETKQKLSLSKKGKPSKTKGVKKPPISDQLRLKRSLNQIGVKNHFYGKHHTEEAKKKIKESWIKRKQKVA
jgi:group I intron endonuclease